MSGGRSALVAGAGIAGLAAATVLAEQGWQVDLVERRQTFDAVPTGLFVPANGMRAFRSLGVGDSVIAHGQPIEELHALGVGTDAVGVATLAQIWPGVGPSVGIGRQSMSELLRDWCPVEPRMGVGILAATPLDDGSVQVALSDGSTYDCDLVVGADGVRSSARRGLWPDVRAQYAGECWWRGVVECPPELTAWTICFCRQGSFLVIPIGAGRAYWTAGVSASEPFDDPIAGRAERLRDRFVDVADSLAGVLSQVVDDAAVQFSVAEQVWTDSPVRGRVVLVGDACHATTPSMAQGAAMAAEDVVVLAAELADGDDIDAALARYVDRRVARTKFVQDTTAMRNEIAAKPLDQRLPVIPIFSDVSILSFSALVGLA
jgi:2-polyprenyl-6-methoxyphenol hydroxylase-like FAD-dependent oxidoreductase